MIGQKRAETAGATIGLPSPTGEVFDMIAGSC